MPGILAILVAFEFRRFIVSPLIDVEILHDSSLQ